MGAVRVGVARPVKMRTVRLGFAKMSSLLQIRELGGGWAYKNEGREGGGGQARMVRLEFAKTSTRVLAFANKSESLGVGWAYKNDNGEGWGGQACKNEGGEARVY